MTDISKLGYAELVELTTRYGSGRKAAEALSIPRTTFQDRLAKAKSEEFVSRKTVASRKILASDKPQYFILSSAQDGTKVNEPFLANLERYAKFLGAEIMISGFTYGKSLFEDHSKANASYHQTIAPYMSNERVYIGTQLVWCGEMNTLPTAVNPLSGFQNYTGIRSGVFPHPKVQLESIPTMKSEPSKIIMTTGAVTLPNYVAKKAGIKAEYHHIPGAVLVELATDGRFFARHLIADETGAFYDLDRHVTSAGVQIAQFCEAITWGDIHTNKLDRDIFTGCFGLYSARCFFDNVHDDLTPDEFLPLFERVQPTYQFFHDLLDFEVRNHHNISDALFRFKQHKLNATVEQEIENCAQFLEATYHPDTLSVIVESNHDLAFERWLKTADYRQDPANVEFFLKNVMKLYKNVDNPKFSILADNLNELLGPLNEFVFLKQDESFKVAKWDKGGIECALHGHNGMNGARPNTKAFTKLGTRANVAHTHHAAIYEGVYQAGVTASLEHGYNVGPSSWNHSHILTHMNAKRQIVTMNERGEYTTFTY